MIRWRQSEVEEFFGVKATYYDGPHSYEFVVSQDGVSLLVTLFGENPRTRRPSPNA